VSVLDRNVFDLPHLVGVLLLNIPHQTISSNVNVAGEDLSGSGEVGFNTIGVLFKG
jgi:hypothetical protein